MEDHYRARAGLPHGSGDDESREDFNVARFLRGVIEPDSRSTMSEAEQRAVVVGTAADGGVLLPELWSTKLIDLARKTPRTLPRAAAGWAGLYDSRAGLADRWLARRALAAAHVFPLAVLV